MPPLTIVPLKEAGLQPSSDSPPAAPANQFVNDCSGVLIGPNELHDTSRFPPNCVITGGSLSVTVNLFVTG